MTILWSGTGGWANPARAHIHNKFASIPGHPGLDATTVLRTILFSKADGKQCRVRVCASYSETIVYKDFRGGRFMVMTLSE